MIRGGSRVVAASVRGGVDETGWGVLDFAQTRTEAFRWLAVGLGILGWASNPLILLVTSSTAVSEQVFITGLCLTAGASLGWAFLRHGTGPAATCLALGLSAAVWTVAARDPHGPATALFALVVIAAGTVGGSRHGFVWAAVGSLLVHLVGQRAGAGFSDADAVALLLVWGSAAMVWLGFRPAYAAAAWAWDGYHEKLRLADELRVRQGEL